MKKLLRKSFLFLATFGLLAGNLEAAAVSPANNPVTIVNNPVPVPAEPGAVSVKSALAELKSLSRQEKKSRIKEVKKALKQYKKDKKNGRETDQILLVILAILLPPLAVYLHEGEINSKFWISILLTLLFWLPGVIYALVVIFDKD